MRHPALVISLLLIGLSASRAHGEEDAESCLKLLARRGISIEFSSAIKKSGGCEKLDYKELDKLKAESLKSISTTLNDLKTKKIKKSSLFGFGESDGELSKEEICPTAHAALKNNLEKILNKDYETHLKRCPSLKEVFLSGFGELHSNIDYLSTSDLKSVCMDLEKTGQKFDEMVVKCADEKPATEKTTCDRADVVKKLTGLISEDSQEFFKKQRQLTVLKLTQATAESKSGTLEKFINASSKGLAEVDHSKVKESLVKLYQENGKQGDLEALKKLTEKNDFSYWNQDTRLQDKDLSILVMAQRTGLESSPFTEVDSAIIWANAEMTESLPPGSPEANQLLMSGQVVRLRGGIKGTDAKSETELKSEIEAADLAMSELVKKVKQNLQSDPALAKCDLAECPLEGSLIAPTLLAEAMAKVVGALKVEDMGDLSTKPEAEKISKTVGRKLASQKAKNKAQYDAKLKKQQDEWTKIQSKPWNTEDLSTKPGTEEISKNVGRKLAADKSKSKAQYETLLKTQQDEWTKKQKEDKAKWKNSP